MVAVVILAMVSFGIFLAFTTGFQGMADAKDRTAASNYAQLILEDYKNTPFEKIISFSEPIVDSKFTQNVIVSSIKNNLKKVITEISWTDRNGKSKNVISSIIIYDSQGTAESGADAAGIFLYADPYYNLLPGTDENVVPAKIIAEIVDENGYLVTDWSGANVMFTIESAVNLDNESQATDYLGTLSDLSVSAIQGRATTYFHPYTTEKREGFVKIKATLDIGDGVEVYDTLTLKITDGAVAIVLSTDKNIIATEGGEDGTAAITATIVNAIDAPIDSDKEVNFSIISGPGNLVNYIPTSVGLSYIDLISGSTAGFTTIIATSPLLEGDSIDIEIRNPGLNIISVETDKSIIVQQGSAVITAYLKNYLEIPISGENINFTTTIGLLSVENDTTGDNGEAVTTLTMNYAGTAVVTASWTAEDSTVISDSVEVICKNHNLYVWADPLTVIEGSSSIIYAELMDYYGDYVVDELIYFVTIGENTASGSLQEESDTTNADGTASVILDMSLPGSTTIQAYWIGDPEIVAGNVDVESIESPEYNITINAVPTILEGPDDSTEITATVTLNDDPASNIDVTFTISGGTGIFSDSSDGIVSTESDGTAVITLSNVDFGDDNLVTVTAYVQGAIAEIEISYLAPVLNILLIDGTTHYGSGNQGDKQIYYGINVSGGSINLNQIHVKWTPDGDEKLKDVYINDTLVYSLPRGAHNDTTITFNQGSPYPLEEGDYTVVMIFKSGVVGKDWYISFFNPNTGEFIDLDEFPFTIE